MPQLRTLLAVVVALTALLFASHALAAPPTKVQCVDANEEADSLKKRGSLRAARASYLTCANAACPRLVRDDCNLRVTELEAAIPTVTFTAKNGGADTTAVSVTMDGEVLAKEVTGTAIPVDPGAHTFRYALAGAPTQTEKLVIREGEKNRQIVIQFGEAAKAEVPTGRLVVTSGAAATISIDRKSTTMARFDSPVAAGSHEVHVSEPGKVPATRIVEVKSNSTETLSVALESEKKSLVPWIVGGAAVATAALVVGGILLFSSTETRTVPPPQGSLGGIGIASFR